MAVVKGTYDLRHTVDRKTAYLPVGSNAAGAEARRQQLELKSALKANARAAGVQVVDQAEGKTLKATAAAYILNAIKRGADEAAVQAKLVTGEFLRMTSREFVHEVTQDDIFAYHIWLRKNQCGDRTVASHPWSRAVNGYYNQQLASRDRLIAHSPAQATAVA